MNYTAPPQTPLERILQSNGKLSEIIHKSAALKKIEGLLQTELSEFLLCANPDLVNAVRVMNFEKSRLQLLCDNAAISTRLRYLLPELILKLRKQYSLSNLITIDLKIAQTVMPPVSTAPQKKTSISSYSSALLKSTLALLKNKEK